MKKTENKLKTEGKRMRNFKEKDIVSHFKRDMLSDDELKREPNRYLYEIICFAKDSESLNDVVVYRALYGEKTAFVRPLDEFFSKTDKEKYPNAAQHYRFEIFKKSIDK